MVKRPARVSAMEARALGAHRCLGGVFNRSRGLFLGHFSGSADGLGGHKARIRLMQSCDGLSFNTRVGGNSQKYDLFASTAATISTSTVHKRARVSGV